MAVAIGIAQVAAATAGGDQTITTSTSIGTPSAAFFVVSRATVNGTKAVDAALSIGATDGTRQRCITAHSRNGLGTTDTADRGATDEVIQITNTGDHNIEAEANFKNWTTDGCVITWGNTPASGYLIFVVFFAGVDSAYVNEFDSAEELDGEVDVTDPGFEPDQLFLFTTSGVINDIGSNSARLTMGVCDNDGATPYPQACMNLSDPDNHSTSSLGGITRNNRVSQNLWRSSIFGDIEIDSFDASGFSSFTRIAPGIQQGVCYLALKYSSDGSVGHWAGSIDSPVSTGNWAVTAPGFTPQFMLLGMNMCNTDDTIENDNDAGVFALGVATADDECVAGYYSEDGVATSDTDSLADNQIVNVMSPGTDTTTTFDGTWTSFDANGWTVNFTTVNGTTREWFGLAVETDAAVTVSRGWPIGGGVGGAGAILGG